MLKYNLIICFLFVQQVSNKQIIRNNLLFRNNENSKDNNVQNNIYYKECIKHVLYTIWNSNEEWAIKMLDASSKIPSGLLAGNLIDMGSFEECVSVEHIYKNETISGNYCKVQIPVKKFEILIDYFTGKGNNILLKLTDNVDINNVIMVFAICVPKTCKEIILNDLLRGNRFEAHVLNCQSKEDDEFDFVDIAAILFFMSLLIFISSCTVFDYYCTYNKKESINYIIIEAFSLIKNSKKLFQIEQKSNEMKCLHGIKSLSMLWIILGHTYNTSFLSPTINSADIVKWFENITSMIPLGATLAVDTFFMLSGLLTSYIYLSIIKNGISFKIHVYYIHRYIRLTPALGALILFHVTLIKYISSGPLWPEIMQILNKNCVNYWWTALLYIQNYVNPTEICILQSWYLSVDMQLFILTPLILIPLGKYPKRTIIFLIFLILLSMIISGYFAWQYKISGFIVNAIMNDNTITKFYYNTFIRCGPMLIGVILGYFINEKTHLKRFNMLLSNKYFTLTGWFISISTLALIIFGQNNIQKHEYDQIESSIYLGAHRISWCISLSWIIYACIYGYGGLINKFLSLSVFQILSRLTYSMYLTHFTLQWIHVGRLRHSIYFSNYQNIYNFCADFVQTLIASIILTLTFESPLIAIEKYCFNRNRSN